MTNKFKIKKYKLRRKKMKKMTIVPIGIIAVVLITVMMFACSMDLVPGDDATADGTSLPAEPSDPSKGLIHIGVQPVSSRLLDQLSQSASGDVTSKAILFATKVDFTLDYPDATGIPDETWSRTVTFTPPGDDMPSLATTAEEVVPADGLTLTAEVFNSTVSTTQPVITGTSAPFDVNAGVTSSVTIIGIPANTTTLPQSTPTSATLAQFPYTIDGSGVMSISAVGGEGWFDMSLDRTGISGAGHYFRVMVDPSTSDGQDTDAYCMPIGTDGSWLLQGADSGSAYGFGITDVSENPMYPDTRAAFMIELPDSSDPDYTDPTDAFIAVVLGNVTGSTAAADYTVEWDVLSRPETVYSNVDQTSAVTLAQLSAQTKEIFYNDNTTEDYLLTHYYVLEPTDLAPAVNDITVNVSFDVLEQGHLLDTLGPSDDGMLLLVGDDGSGETEISPATVTFPDQQTIELTYSFDASPYTGGIFFKIGAGQKGNQYTVEWSNQTSGYVEGTIE
jgi:hypothetical protein